MAKGTPGPGALHEKKKKTMRVLLVSDYFHPSVGGVETHMYNLAENLVGLGHKVVVLTCCRGGRCGVRYLRGGVKVYHLPRVPVVGGTTLPNLGALRPFRAVAIRERVEIVHCHQTSSLSLECLLHAKTLGLRCVFTCHSLQGFAEVPSIWLNKCLKVACASADACVCVSHVSKENLVLRASVRPDDVFVIPNAVHTSVFNARRRLKRIRQTSGEFARLKRVCIVSRLVYRRGIDLLCQILAEACALDPDLQFTVVGDGPKRTELERVVRQEGLERRVALLGNLPHEDVVGVLDDHNIFLNLSLTEAFGMAMLEAAAAGLLVVTTSVGGIPEIFPRLAETDLKDAVGMVLCKPEAGSVLRGLRQALGRLPRAASAIKRQHELVREAYSWEDVARRTELVYSYCGSGGSGEALYERMARGVKCGAVLGPIYCCLMVFQAIYLWALGMIQPTVELARDDPLDNR